MLGQILQARDGQPNLAAAAREFLVSPQRLQARWNARPSKSEMTLGSRRLRKYQEFKLAVCQYLNRLDYIGLPARLFMIMDCANVILQGSYDHDGNDSDFPP